MRSVPASTLAGGSSACWTRAASRRSGRASLCQAQTVLGLAAGRDIGLDADEVRDLADASRTGVMDSRFQKGVPSFR